MMTRIMMLLSLLLMLSGSSQSDLPRPVVALLSDDNTIYKQALDSFKGSINRNVLVYDLGGDIKKAPEVLKSIMQRKPALIFALGAKAAWFAKSATRDKTDTAVLFAMVLNHKRYQLHDGQANVTGISADVAPGTQIFNLSLFSPGIKRIGVIYSQTHSTETLLSAQRAAGILGIELVAESIERAKEFPRAWRKMSDMVDAFWVLNDPVLYTLENIYWLKDRCLKERVICTGQSDNITRLGVLLSVSPDVKGVGVQAAAMAHDILNRGRKPASLGIKPPLGTLLTLNESTAKKIGLVISESARSVLTDVIK